MVLLGFQVGTLNSFSAHSKSPRHFLGWGSWFDDPEPLPFRRLRDDAKKDITNKWETQIKVVDPKSNWKHGKLYKFLIKSYFSMDLLVFFLVAIK